MAARLEISVSFALAATLLCCILGHCEMSVYPGLRRRPIQAPAMDPQSEQEYAFLAQMMEQYARRRLQQQFDQQLHEINLKMDRQRQLLERERYRQRQQELEVRREQEEDYEAANGGNNLEQQYDQYDNAEAEASYGSPLEAGPDVQQPPQLYLPRLPNLPPLPKSSPGRNSVLRDRIPFAVGPNDARFFDNPNDPSGELDSRALEDYEEYAPIEPTPEVATASSKAKIETPVPAPVPVEPPKLLDVASANFHRINPQSVAAAAVAGVNLPQAKDQTPQELNALISKLQKQSKSPHLTLVNDAVADQEQIVLRQHLGMNSEMGVYIVALIAGVSAAVTVGLLALGVTWFHNRHKAAADVEYPAYGVTGPNKDVSPSGDRKLAQSAQMYHYQHQKQQIIAMENCQATDGSCSLSDVESDDDNEEGDYTVYECPGLAPTGEMEVKNPLFLDETPATPANNLSTAGGVAAAGAGATNNNITQATPQQPATQKKGTVKPNMNLLNAAATAAAAAAAASGGEGPKPKRKSKK
ncbi:hypothetical protein KR054_004855 [Drosophila jambulina]|nr:hypothetical protein KR054_004855 [Drosophila jambulina]